MEFASLRSQLEVLKSFRRPWFITGGWAIDLFLGRETRDHKDVDVAIFREDQFELRRHLSQWKWEKLVNGSPDSWDSNEWIEHWLFKEVHRRLDWLIMLISERLQKLIDISGRYQ
jgi:Aminoglycoside-2''-adenylyltransferase